MKFLCILKGFKMEYLSHLTNIIFILITAGTIWLYYRAGNKSLTLLLILLPWLLIQTALSIKGFYQNTSTIPPRFVFLILPPVLIIIGLFVSVRGRRFTDQLNPVILTLIHTIRIPVELVLYGLFLEKQVPQLMTFAGGNYDIFSGLTAPLVYYFGFVKKIIGRKIILTWNLICLGLLLSIVVHAILSVPSPFQKFAFDQPDIAILKFPFVWLPSIIVPAVLYSHLASIRYLLRKKTGSILKSKYSLSTGAGIRGLAE
jgi:hypothetical protein